MTRTKNNAHCILNGQPVSSFGALMTMMFFLTAGLATTCPAQSTFEWNNKSNSFYDISGNWTPGGPPTSIDVALFNQDGIYQVLWDTVTASRTPDVGFVDVIGDNVTFRNLFANQLGFTINEDLTVFGSFAELTNSGLNLTVSGSTFVIGDAVLRIDGSNSAGSQFNSVGSVLAAQGTLSFESGAVGILAGVDLNVDNAGIAVFDVLGGSQVTANAIRIGNGASQFATSAGTLNVSGSGSSLALDSTTNFSIGNSAGLGQHVVNVTDGGSLGINLNTSAELQIGTSGILNINNATVVHNQAGGALTIDGDLNIAGGGSLASAVSEVSIAQSSGSQSQVSVSGAGTVWNNTGTMRVGLGGNGSLDILDGGVVNNDGDATVSSILGSGSGLVTVNGPGSQWNVSQEIGVGGTDESGNDSLQIENGGLVTSQSGRIGNFDDGVGNVTVNGSGSRWENSSFLHVGDLGSGILTIESGGVVTDALGEIRFNGTASVNGTGSSMESWFAVDGEWLAQRGGRRPGFQYGWSDWLLRRGNGYRQRLKVEQFRQFDRWRIRCWDIGNPKRSRGDRV